MVFKFVDTPIRHRVISEFGDGSMVILYTGGDYNRAVEVCNFWDERQNTWLHTDAPAMDALSVAMRKFDALERYIANA